MADIGRIRMRLPSSIKTGDMVRVRALVIHPMEIVQRVDGKPVDKNYHFIHRMVATFNGRDLLDAELTQSVSQNPFFSFTFKAVEQGTLKVIFFDTHGRQYEGSAEVKFS